AQLPFQPETGGVDVAVPKRVVPLELGDERDDWAGDDEDEDRKHKQRNPAPEPAWDLRHPDLPAGVERTAALERVKRPVPSRHSERKLRPTPEPLRPR